jgi:hypothetical protein
MEDVYQRVLHRAKPLGNHARKHLRAIERHGQLLTTRLDETGGLSRVPLEHATPASAEAFRQVSHAGRDESESLTLIGTYYGIQYLHLCSRELERLAMDLAERPGRRQAYRSFLRRTEEEFTSLISAYLRRALRILMPSALGSSFVICAVGTRGHQDDLDVAVIDDGSDDRRQVDKVVGRLTVQMVRYASAFDHYLAERVGAERFSLSNLELCERLHSGPLDFVVVSELMRAEPLVGNRLLCRQLWDEVIEPFLFHPDQGNDRHELYLRGLLGELRSLLLRPAPSGVVNPKDDALRLILTLILAYKVVDRLEATRTRDLLKQLRAQRPGLRAWLSRLDRASIFLETFRHVAHLLIAQEEAVDVESEAGREQLDRLAAAMGYEDSVGVQAAEHLLVHYHEAVQDVRAAAEPLVDALTQHLETHSWFQVWNARMTRNERPGNAALELARGAEPFVGVYFWDDLLKLFAAPDGKLLDAFVTDYLALRPSTRRGLAAAFADWGRAAPYALMSLLNQVSRQSANPRVTEVIDELARTYIDRLGSGYEDVRNVVRVFRFYPGVVNDFLLARSREDLDDLRGSLDAPVANPEIVEAREGLLDLIHVHRSTSRYVKRVLRRLTLRRPTTVLALADDEAMRTLAQGRLAASERHLERDRQKELLGDYYDMEFLRISICTLRGRPIADVRAQFFKLTESYLRALFDVCVREVEQDMGQRFVQRDRLGLFLAGGHARRRPYDEDYDVIALLDTTDETAWQFAERAIAKMNRQIARRGVIAQYRIGEVLGSFVTRFGELARWLQDDPDGAMVERHQLLGSRLVVGSRRVETSLRRRLLDPHIFDEAPRFFERLRRELFERREKQRDMPEGLLHLKEMPGGLREIDLALAAAKVLHRIYEPLEDLLPQRLAREDPAHADLYRDLGEVADFFVALRSAYRVCVAASDVIEQSFLGGPAEVLGLTETGSALSKAELFQKVLDQGERASEAVQELITSLNQRQLA